MQPRISEVVLFDEIGCGPGGSVFRGSFRGAACTVKLPRPASATSNQAGRSFEQDILQLARLRHAGLPRVLQLDATDETPYAILEWQQGQSLAEVLEELVADSEAGELALRLATAVFELHSAGFVHGDLACEHILWSRGTRRLELVDTGSIQRPIPFDAAIDCQALGSVLLLLAGRTLVNGAGSELASIAATWSSSQRPQLQQLIQALSARYAGHTQHAQGARARSRQHGLAAYGGMAKPGRAELTLLRRCWETPGDHEGKVLVVLGPAGSGKSRLLRDFGEFLQTQSALVLSIRCADSDWAPFSAIKRLLEKYLHDVARLDAKHRAQVEQALRAASGSMASHLRLLSPQLALMFSGAEPVIREGDAQQFFIDGLADFLAKCLENSPRSVLIIDDVHWLDASSRMVLSRLAVRLCPLGHMIVCGARDDEDLRETIDRLETVLPTGLFAKVPLGPLTERDARAVVAEFLGESQISQENIVEPLSRLSDCTPLSLLELLDLAFEQRLLRPRYGTWHLDGERLMQLRLPASSRALVERRLSLLDSSTIALLRVAAVVRSHVDAQVLAAATDTHVDQARIALDRATTARLLARNPDSSSYEFVHDCVWEALLRPVPAHEQCALHQRVADALYSQPSSASDHDYQLARHLAAGIIAHNPQRTYEVLRHAARRAVAACDDALTLSFLHPAERAAELAQILPPQDFYVDLAETSLRTGATTESLIYFELALTRSRPGLEAAHVLGRMAWVHHNESHANACWTTLEAALLEYKRSVPGDGPLAMLGAGIDRLVLPTTLGTARLRQPDIETLCGLYALCARVSLESGRPVRMLGSIMHLAAAATRLAPCRVLVEAELQIAFGLALVSARAPWRPHLTRARALARQLADPVAQTLCHQFHHVIATWQGDLEESERQALICVDERGNYMQLGELCHLCFGMYAVEITRGRPEQGLAWLERAITRVQQRSRAPAVFALIEEAACTTLLALGREHEIPGLRRRVTRVQRPEIRPGSYFYLCTYQTRVQRLIDADELGQPFEVLLREWQGLHQSPKAAHIIVVVFYLQVAHARVQQCFRAHPAERSELIIKLERALADVEATARMPLLAAHAQVTRAALWWLRGARAQAERSLIKAEELARATGCVWVTFAAARLRAHMLKATGKLAAARDEARHAAQVAQSYGHPQRLRAICEEFDLPELLRQETPSETDTPSVRRHLDALLHIAQASSRDLGSSRQARFIVDELLETLAAERGFLFMRDANNGTLQCHAACHAAHLAAENDLLEVGAGYDNTRVEQVYATGQTLLGGCSELHGDNTASQERACIVVALVLREQVVGVLYLDRPAAAGSFGGEDVALLEALANQVPVALELADALRERDRLEHNLRQAQKMEAIGRLAGGIAHDFNNILATIEFAAGCLSGYISTQGEEDLSEIRDAARRGADLTRQLLMFSRGKSVPPRRIDLVEVLQRMGPMLGRMVRADVTIDMNLSHEPLATMADPSQFERLLMNLARNASDAMPQGGTISVRLALATDVPEHLTSYGTPNQPTYAELSVTDTGTGMNEEVRTRLFEPFFTTKTSQQGTGLGLAIVYTIVKQYGGHIEVSSELEVGSTFKIYLPLCSEVPKLDTLRLPPKRSEHATLRDDPRPGRATVMVVDDEDALRKQSARMLEAAGFDIQSACDGEDALRVIATTGKLPELVVTDLQMPKMDGMQLAARLLADQPDIKLLFVSGDSPDALISSGWLNENAVFLQKPFKPEALLREVEMLLMLDEEDHDFTARHSGVFKRALTLAPAPVPAIEADDAE